MKALAAVLLLSGCASMSEVPKAEYAWQALLLVDAGQTIQIAQHRECYYEDNPVTHRVIGRHPDVLPVVAWMLGMSALHYAITMSLEERDVPPWVRSGWQMLTIGKSAETVAHNYDIGLSPTGASCP